MKAPKIDNPDMNAPDMNASEANAPAQISLQVNGEIQCCSPQRLLPDFLEQLNFNLRLVAVEYNGEILHRQFWSQTVLQDGDRLEIVTIVGGG